MKSILLFLICAYLFSFNQNALADESPVTITTGGYFRWSEEWFTHPNFGRGTDESQGYFLQRYMAHIEMKDKDSGVRWYFQAKYSEAANKFAPYSGLDRDDGDVHQIFFENKYVRIGRQESTIGSGLLYSLREGPNSRLSYDGAKIFSKSDLQWELFAGHPVDISSGFVDNFSSTTFTSYLYFTSLLKADPTQLDLYLVYYDAESELVTLGSRLVVKNDSVNWDTDFMLQGGTLGEKDVAAYGVASRLTVPIGSLDGTLIASYFSGDKDPNDDKYNTFNALFPKGQYYSWSSELGHPNLMALQPGVVWRPLANLSWAASVGWFWRENIHDGIYRGNGTLLRVSTNEERFIETQINSNAEWKINKLLSLYGEYTYAAAGDFIRATPGAVDSQYFALRTALRF